jgi:Family of unknown function (DUF5694)
MKQMEAEQKTTPVKKMLARMNDPTRINADHREFYYALRLGNATEQPGTHVNGAWYLRNAKIFAKLIQIARPAGRRSSFSVPASPTGSAISCKTGLASN